MFPLLVRTVIMYIFIIAGVRLMGKRQIGELQPSELVVTILLSDIATAPLQSNKVPILQPVMVIMLVIALELLFSWISIKWSGFRTAVQGNSILVIKNGTLDQKALRELRFSVDDIIEALRLKDVFDLSEVAFAYVETNGSLSVLRRDQNEPNPNKPALQCLVVSDGKIVDEEFDVCALDREKLQAILRAKGLRERDVFLMTYAEDGSMNLIEKEKTP